MDTQKLEEIVQELEQMKQEAEQRMPLFARREVVDRIERIIQKLRSVING